MIINSYLTDYDFLYDLDQERNKIIRIKVTALAWDESPISSIEGNITNGSINIDGNSVVRRTCSLTMVAKNIDLDSFYQGLNTKFMIEVGIQNKVNSNYPDFIWMPQGIFILTSFNSSVAGNNYTISLSGKDKMCLLNGDVAGSLGASIDFGVEEIVDTDGSITYNHILLKDIIYNIVNSYGQETSEKITISDLDMYGYSLMKYRGNNPPLYLLIKEGTVQNIILDDKFQVYKDGVVDPIDISDDKKLIYLQGVESQLISENATNVSLTESGPFDLQIRKIQSGDTAGYRYTDLTYAGDLIAKPGESITSILDKIVKMLGNYEYFYDVYGQFIFQRKKNNLYNNWIPEVSHSGENATTENYIDPLLSSINYSFYGSDMFTSVSHNPDFMTIKNDYSIWGERETVSGIKVPIYLRYALHRKPVRYTSYNDVQYVSTTFNEPAPGATVVDWREIIFQMAKDHFAHNREDDFFYTIATNNPDDYPTGRTGYEMFYTDLLSFWRQLYNIEATTEDQDFYLDDDEKKYWHKDIYESPTSLNFWFDFLGENTPLDQYSIPAIGDRTKVINDTSVSAIYFKETPDVLLHYGDEDKTQPTEGYTIINIPQYLQNAFNVSERRKSAFEVLDQILYENTQSKESVSINAIPIYHLQPNSRIGISNNNSGLHGEFILSKITLPLTYNGTMSLTATRAIDTIY